MLNRFKKNLWQNNGLTDTFSSGFVELQAGRTDALGSAFQSLHAFKLASHSSAGVATCDEIRK